MGVVVATGWSLVNDKSEFNELLGYYYALNDCKSIARKNLIDVTVHRLGCGLGYPEYNQEIEFSGNKNQRTHMLVSVNKEVIISNGELYVYDRDKHELYKGLKHTLCLSLGESNPINNSKTLIVDRKDKIEELIFQLEERIKSFKDE